MPGFVLMTKAKPFWRLRELSCQHSNETNAGDNATKTNSAANGA